MEISLLDILGNPLSVIADSPRKKCGGLVCGEKKNTLLVPVRVPVRM